jgi:hypothetical protein
VNVYSRVQMMLFKARLAAKAEYKAVLEETGLTVEEMRAYLAKKRWRGIVAVLSAPREGGQHGANLAQHVADDIKKTRTAKIIDFDKRVLARRSAKTEHARGRWRRRAPFGTRTSRTHAARPDREAAGDRPPRAPGDRERRPGPEARARGGQHRQRSAGQADSRRGERGETVAPRAPAPSAPLQAPVVVYFDGKDHRTKKKIEELLRGRDIGSASSNVAPTSERSGRHRAPNPKSFRSLDRGRRGGFQVTQLTSGELNAASSAQYAVSPSRLRRRRVRAWA